MRGRRGRGTRVRAKEECERNDPLANEARSLLDRGISNPALVSERSHLAEVFELDVELLD